MKYIWTIPAMLLIASPVMGAYPKMESTSFVITSSEISGMGKYKLSESFDTWDSLGQPSPIGQWPKGDGASIGSQNSGSGWIYTFNLPVWWDKDHDRDGMPLAYEEQFANWNGHTMWDYNPLDASEDWDNDGFTNIQEYLCRSDPTDGSSFFQFTDIRLVTSDGRPLLAWWSTTTSITGFEGDYPDYPRSLGFDILYADWSVESQADQKMPNEDWFNQTGTWQLVSGATGLKRDGAFNTYTDDIAGGAMGDGDIRFYRLAIGQTWDEGTPEWGSWDYYSAVGNRILCSTVARETLMIQKHTIAAGTDLALFGLAGTTTGGDGKLDFILGTNFFPSGTSPSGATNFNLWESASATETVDYLQYAGPGNINWKDDGGNPSTRKVTGDDGFRMIYNPSGLASSLTFYAAAQLKMDSYYHEIHKRDWNGQTISPGDEGWDLPQNNQVTFLQYNFPVEARFIGGLSTDFPTLAGTTSAQFPGWEAFESDWVIFYDRDSNEDVIIYYDHATGAGHERWEYFLPLSQLGEAVGTELVFSPGSPTVTMQYWNPNDPIPGASFSMEDNVPYQNSGNNKIKTYLKY